MKNIIVIGVSGGSASGKTTVVNRLKDICKERVELISHDCYYKPFEELTPEERTRVNYDHPDAFDTQLLIEHIKKLKMSVPIDRPVYSVLRPYPGSDSKDKNAAKAFWYGAFSFL